MPFRSKAQRRFMFAVHPRIARRWAEEEKAAGIAGRKLPERVSKPKAKKSEFVELEALEKKSAQDKPERKTGVKRIDVRAHTRSTKSGKRINVKAHTRVIEGPYSTEVLPIPKTKNAVWEYGLHDHHALRAGRHFDLRLGDEKGHAHSWAIRKFPERGKASLAFQTFTHDRDYMDFEGRLTGYGAGTVKLAERGQALIHSSDDNKIVFSVLKGRQSEDYALIRIKGKVWLLQHLTPPEAPSGKPKYREISWAREAVTDNPNIVVESKLDGAHTIVVMEPNKRARAYSQARTKAGEPIEYTHKIPGLFDVKWQGKGTTILRGETVAVGKNDRPLHVSITSGLLNANLLTSIRTQAQKGTPLKVFLFDVVRYNGKDVTNLPYSERLSLLRSIVKKHPIFGLPDIATTPEEKAKLLQRVESGKHPLTKEGVVIWDEKGPTKMKTKKEFDVFIREFYPSIGKGEFAKAIGGFRYSLTPKGPILGNVGTGFSLKERQRMFQHPEEYLGRVAKVYAMEQLRSGALRAPSYHSLHIEKQ